MIMAEEQKKNQTGAEMPLMDHLTELRKRLFLVVVVNVITIGIAFGYTELLMEYLLALVGDMKLVYIGPSELFLVYVQLAVIAGVIVASPFTTFQLWAFMRKGLYKREKRYILGSLFFGLICFAVGVYFCYTMVLPITIDFFTRIAISEVSAMISVQSYTSFVNMMLLGFGVVFEMPVLIFLLTQLGIINPEFLIKHRGVMIVCIFILAAIITPPDVVSQLMLAMPMLVLLQISIFISKIVYLSNQKKKLKDAA